jgi:hypothetical protein
MKTAERTIERPQVDRPVAPDTKRRPMIMLIGVLIALALGVLAGFVLWGTDDTTSTAAVAAGGTELTPRQEQMVDLVDDYGVAWRNGDSEAAAAMFTENGALTVFGTEYPVEGDALAGYISAFPQPTLDLLEPVLVSDDGMIMFHTIAGMGTFSDVFRFTADGELLIISHEIAE